VNAKISFLKKAFVYLLGRLVKFVANTSKVSCYLFHYVFPNKRFSIPLHSGPLFRGRQNAGIPRILWQTNFTNRVTLPAYLNYLWNRLMAYNFEYRFVINDHSYEFVHQHYSSDVYEQYVRLQIGAAIADFWRLLVLRKHGGVYLDFDANLVWPLGSTLKPFSESLYITERDGRFTNCFIAAKPERAEFDMMIRLITKNIEEGSIKNVYELTGPSVFDQVLEGFEVDSLSYRFVCSQGNFTNEHFQYIDSQQGKWTHAQKKIPIVKNES
jgi:mannosyltransferase OCH1-like enzyme